MQEKKHNLSDDFCKYLELDMPDYAGVLIETLETTDPSVSLRVNSLKSSVGEIEKIFPNLICSPVPWCSTQGRYLSNRPDFTHTPAFHQGLFYVQDASSMAVARIVAMLADNLRNRGVEVVSYLDACAAPGGKTTAAIAALPSSALIVANEYDYRRAEILKENIIKWGAPNTVVCRGDTSRFSSLKNRFHIIAADVPCSGEGMMRKDAAAREQWSRALVQQCVERQHEILSNLWPSLRPGGYLIYSTCTFNRRENEENMAWLTKEFDAEVVSPRLDIFPGAITMPDETMLRFLPSLVQGEGLAIGIIKKLGENTAEMLQRSKQRKNSCRQQANNEALQTVNCWVTNQGNDFERVVLADEIYLVPKLHALAIADFEKALNVIYRGVGVGTLKGKKVIPMHALAMSNIYNTNAFPMVELEREAALAYLRRETLPELSDAPTGMMMVSYGNRPLGFVNNLANRANNLYPQQWRILH